VIAIRGWSVVGAGPPSEWVCRRSLLGDVADKSKQVVS